MKSSRDTPMGTVLFAAPDVAYGSSPIKGKPQDMNPKWIRFKCPSVYRNNQVG